MEAGIKEFVDFYEKNRTWKTAEDIIKVAKEQKCDTVIIVSNFKLAIELMSRLRLKTVYVIVPRIMSTVEIYKADIYVIHSQEIILTKYEEKKGSKTSKRT